MCGVGRSPGSRKGSPAVAAYWDCTVRYETDTFTSYFTCRRGRDGKAPRGFVPRENVFCAAGVVRSSACRACPPLSGHPVNPTASPSGPSCCILRLVSAAALCWAGQQGISSHWISARMAPSQGTQLRVGAASSPWQRRAARAFLGTGERRISLPR